MVAKPKPTRATRSRIKVKAVEPKKKAKKIKIEEADYWFSLCVRERANWTCEACGKYYEPWTSVKGQPANPGLHCSHYIGRANKAVRFEPLNANAHCYGCHTKFEGNPHEFKEWKIEQLGQEKYDIVIEKSKSIVLGRQAYKEKEQIAEHFKEQFKRMQSARSHYNWNGWLDFQGYF